jgi:hypothetical protein
MNRSYTIGNFEVGHPRCVLPTMSNGECVSRHEHNNEGFIVSMVRY